MHICQKSEHLHFSGRICLLNEISRHWNIEQVRSTCFVVRAPNAIQWLFFKSCSPVQDCKRLVNIWMFCLPRKFPSILYCMLFINYSEIKFKFQNLLLVLYDKYKSSIWFAYYFYWKHDEIKENVWNVHSQQLRAEVSSFLKIYSSIHTVCIQFQYKYGRIQ